MAGDWIKMREDLPEDPAVIAIAAATGLDEYGVVGRLHKFWTWTGRHTLDGNARGVTVSWIDRYLHAEGFAAAMIAAGWLVETPDGVSQPNFERHNGQAAKQRALTSKRVANHKAKSNAGVNAKGNASVNARTVSDALPREEKRREDSIPPTPSPTESVGDEAEWGRLEGVLLGEGVVSARLAIDAARGFGRSVQDIEAIISEYRAKPGAWEPGALKRRVSGEWSNWPAERTAFRIQQQQDASTRKAVEQARQRVADQNRVATEEALEDLWGATLDAMSTEEQAELLRQAEPDHVMRIEYGRPNRANLRRRTLLAHLNASRDNARGIRSSLALVGQSGSSPTSGDIESY